MRSRSGHLSPPAIEFKEQKARHYKEPEAKDVQIIDQACRLPNQANSIDIELLVRSIERPEKEIAEGTEQRVHTEPLAERNPAAQRLLSTIDIERVEQQGRAQHQRADRHIPGIHTGDCAKDEGSQEIEKQAARPIL